MTIEKYTLSKLPDEVKHIYIDSDSIAYIGACSVEKTRYKFINKITCEETEHFPDAKTAKKWIEDQTFLAEALCLDFDKDEWERQSWKESKDEAEAIMATKQTLQEWLKLVRKDQTWKGFLTEKGTLKNKDKKGLEDRYQGNREGVVSPKHLIACREWLLAKPEFSLIKGGFEADSIVIAMAERKGKKAALMSIDKDLRQAEGTYCVDMTYDIKKPMIFIADNNVGDVWYCPVKSKGKSKKITGVGFKFLCYQAVAGDTADTYYGLKGVGAVAVMKALEGKETYKDCLDAIYNLYAKKEEYKYISWDGVEQVRTPLELMWQHFDLAYQERSYTDEFSFDKYDWRPTLNG